MLVLIFRLDFSELDFYLKLGQNRQPKSSPRAAPKRFASALASVLLSDRYCTCHLSRRHVKFLWGVWGAAPIARSANPRRRRPMEFPTPAVRTRWGADGWLADAAGPATRSLLASRAPPTDASTACTERRLERCAAMLRPRSRAVCGNAAQRRRHLLAAGRGRDAPRRPRARESASRWYRPTRDVSHRPKFRDDAGNIPSLRGRAGGTVGSRADRPR